MPPTSAVEFTEIAESLNASADDMEAAGCDEADVRKIRDAAAMAAKKAKRLIKEVTRD